MPATVLNYLGQTVFEGDVPMRGGKGMLDVSRLAHGVYIVLLQAPDGTRHQNKIVVQ